MIEPLPSTPPAGSQQREVIMAERLAPLSGVVFLVLGLLGALVLYPSDAPDFVDEPEAIASFYTDKGTDLLPSGLCYLLGGVFLIWFVGTLRSHLSLAEGGTGRLASIAFGGGIAATALLWASAATEVVAALRVEENGSIDPAAATVYSDLSSILFGAAAPMGMAVLLGASALAAFRFGALPKWLGGLAAVIAVGCLIPFISYFVIIISFFWVGVTGVVLYLKTAQPASSAGATRPAQPA